MMKQLAQSALDLAEVLPFEAARKASEAFADQSCWANAALAGCDAVANHAFRHAINRYAEACRVIDGVFPGMAATALFSAALSLRERGHQPEVTPVWTGPEADDLPFRRTEQAVLQVLNAARQRILLVSYSVYRIPHVREALVHAATRGVKINVVVETPDLVESEEAYSTLRALGPEVAACADVYYWPREKREQSDNGKPGILHVKCVVADGETIFVSSANLTEQAFSINMELGVLVKGGDLAGSVQERFNRLIRGQILVPVPLDHVGKHGQ